MSARSSVALDVRLLARVTDRVLLAQPSADAWYVLPGGPVESGEGIEPALDRHLDGLGGPKASAWRFAGAVEHADAPFDRAAGEPLAGHSLTILFAADWPAAVPLPETWRGNRVRAVDIGLLLATRLRPLPVAWVVRRWLAEGWPLWRGAVPAGREPGWAGLRPSLASLRAQLAARRDELRSNRFRDAAVAMCALVTAADGRVDPAERDGLRGFVATDPVMSQFPADELEALFDSHLTRLQADVATGKLAALAEITKVRGRVGEAAAVVRIGEVIGRIDGDFTPSEQAVVREVIGELGLDPTEFAAQTVAPGLT
ncbi:MULTISPECIES: TerB family tellurite resistance protein [Protofrankia]|uniref:Tellurite resistance TerB n=1 Tax=Candidatus Protofrankia datiscae TaxID=2716812 RepID=F8B4U2_9ACTN|nr:MULTISPECIES: TerB family tellurite resistance protein [Protofrankia]AEH10065.1 Tellurite resistance TerB [Candidatus Protofrankia datiscae]